MAIQEMRASHWFAIVCVFSMACGFRSPLHEDRSTTSVPAAGGAASGGQIANSGGAVSAQGGHGGTSWVPVTLCGNKRLDPGEECDDGNLAPGDGCDDHCQYGPERFRSCGNGLVDPGEGCDDGNHSAGDGCDSNCCVEPGWNLPCPGFPTNGRLCCAARTSCSCGNGMVEAAEECDDGNSEDGDGCSRYCRFEPAGTCPNGVLDDHEECDDGNTVAKDGCDDRCRKEICISFPGWGDGL